MICLFCGSPSDESSSVEHVIPESLGNTTLMLPSGVVCDRCNNYFAIKLEKPFLESAEVLVLRFHQRIPSKRGRIPELEGTIGPDAPVTVKQYADGPLIASVYASDEALDLLLNHGADVINFAGYDEPWNEALASRFLAKAALEALAARLVAYPEGLKYVATEPQFDLIRNYARRGQGKLWPFHARRLFDADKKWTLSNGDEIQRVWECDILHTEKGEYYFVLCIFGLELAINYGGPDLRGYLEWLEHHGGQSPLYFGENANNPNNGA